MAPSSDGVRRRAKRGQHVGGQGRKLDADEDHHEIAGGGDEQRAEDREGQQNVELAERHSTLRAGLT